jgi:signal transduction histidine kinase
LKIKAVAEESACERWREKLQGDLARKQQFMMMVAHDMRNLLAPLASAVELLGLDESPTQKKVRPILRRQVTQLKRLVDDLVDIACSEQGYMSLSIHSLDLHEVIVSAVEVAQPAIAVQHHHLTVARVFPEAAIIDGDQCRLTQALSNLLINAAKYTPRGGDIRLALEREEPCFIVRVRDSGIGIAEEMLPKIFDAYERATLKPDFVHGGLGLGLTVARHLVELHGGTLRAHSAGIGKGSEFVMRLPATVHQSLDESATLL